jgi:hypothetical protein
LKIEKLQTRIDKLKAVKKVGSLQYPLPCTAAFHVNVEQEQQKAVILSNNDRAPTNCVVGLKTKLKNEVKEKQEALAKSDSLKKEVSRLDALLRKEAADSRARINEFREVEERHGVRDSDLPRNSVPDTYQNNTQVWAIEQYFMLAEVYPKHRNRPDYSSLQPVYLASMDLRTYLEAVRSLSLIFEWDQPWL